MNLNNFKFDIAKKEQENFILNLFNKINENMLDYAILRNYENYPRFDGDIDIAINFKDINRFNELCVEFTKNLNWDYAINRTSQTGNLLHTYVSDYIFINFTNLVFIQISISNGVHILGIPILNETTLLKNKSSNKIKGFYHIDSTHENLTYLLKIGKFLYQINNVRFKKYAESKLKLYCLKKIIVYRKKIINNNSNHFIKLMSNIFPYTYNHILKALERKSYTVFYLLFMFSCLYFLLNQITTKPIQTIKILAERIISIMTSKKSKKKHTVFYIDANSKCKPLLKTAMNILEKYRFIANLWVLSNANSYTLNEYEKYYLGWRAWVIKWVNKKNIDRSIKINENDDLKAIIIKLMECFIKNLEFKILFFNH